MLRSINSTSIPVSRLFVRSDSPPFLCVVFIQSHTYFMLRQQKKTSHSHRSRSRITKPVSNTSKPTPTATTKRLPFTNKPSHSLHTTAHSQSTKSQPIKLPYTQLQKRHSPPIGSFRRYDPTKLFGTPTYIMTTENRSESLLDCDRRSIEQGISLIFGDWDQDLIVINKPFGVPMGATHRDSIGGRLQTVLGHNSIYPVHRLDKYTSGCLVVALKSDVARVLQYSLQNHTLASIRTTKSNIHQKVKLGHVKQTLGVDENGVPLRIGRDEDDQADEVVRQQHEHKGKNGSVQHSTPPPKIRARDADTSWSKRYRVMVQLTPCVKRDMKAFMIEQHNRLLQIDPTTPPLDFDSNTQSDYLKYYQQYTEYLESRQKSGEMANSEEPTTAITKHAHLHSPDIIRSPYQEGTLYTPIYSVQHRHDHASHDGNHAARALAPPPLLEHGYLHSHLTQRDFFPTEWIQMNDVVHVDHINSHLESRLIDNINHSANLVETTAAETKTSNSLSDPSLNYTNAVGTPGLDDLRVPQGHAHGSALFIENPHTSEMVKVDLSSTPDAQPSDEINNVHKNPHILPKLQHLLSKHNTNALRNLRDAIEYRLLVPGAPRPPDNDDDEADDASEINKSQVFSAEEFQKQLAEFKQTTSEPGFAALPVAKRKAIVYNFFSRLCSADGISIAPFNWINAKIQLFEKVVKMHSLAKIHSKALKMVFRKSESADLYAPDFSVASAGPTVLNTVGKLLIQDTTDTKNALNHVRPGGVQPLDQDGNVIHCHTSDVYFADKDAMLSKNTIEARQHPLYWTSHRVLLKHNTSETTHSLEAFTKWNQIDKNGDFIHHDTHSHSHSVNTTTPDILRPPALQPYELPCGCLLPYATPLPKNLTQEYNDNPDLFFNPHSIIPKLPASAPHPFIPTNYLYESVPPSTYRDKFVPNRNIISLPQNVPAILMGEFEKKKMELERAEIENDKLKESLDQKLQNVVASSTPDQQVANSDQIIEINSNVKTKMKQKQDRNNSRMVEYDFEQHNNHTTGQFGSLLSSQPFGGNGDNTNDGLTEYHSPDYSPESNKAWNLPLSSKRKANREALVAPSHPTRIPTTASSTRLANTNETSGSENIVVSVPNAEAKEATTLFRMHHLNINKGICIYNAKLLSGRTHQLRIHFSDAGLPIRGDPYYNPYYIKHWSGTSLYSFYKRQQFNRYLRAIHILPLFGHCDSGVTAQMCSVDVWDATLSPNVLGSTQGGSLLQQWSKGSNPTDSSNITPHDLLSITPYTPSSFSSTEKTNIFSGEEHQLGEIIAGTSISVYNNIYKSRSNTPTSRAGNRIKQHADSALSHPLSSPTRISSDGNNAEEEEEEDGFVIPPPSESDREISNEELEQYLNIYKAFADASIDGEMFLQSYLIEFPLPTEIKPPKQLKQISTQKVRSEELREKYLQSLLQEGLNVPDCSNNDNTDQQEQQQHQSGDVATSTNKTNEAEIAAVLAQTSRPAFAPRVSLVNPTLTDGLPLYHNRMSKEEVKAEREKRKSAKKLHGMKKMALNQLVESAPVGTLEKCDSTGTFTAGSVESNPDRIVLGNDNDTKVIVHQGNQIAFSDTNATQPEHMTSAEQFAASPDDLDSYIIAEQFDENDELVEGVGNGKEHHPDGFKHIRPLFSSQTNPVWQIINKFTTSPQISEFYDPSKQITVATVQDGGQHFQPDNIVTLQYAGKEVKAPVSHILHLQTQHKSWTYKTAQGTEMVRILLAVPDSWKYAM